MKKTMKKCSVRLDESTIQLINNHPGKNFSDKMRSLASTHMILLNKESGEDLTEKFEIIIKAYLKDTNPKLEKEIVSRRKELNKYMDTLKALDILERKTNELQQRVNACCVESTECEWQKAKEEINEFYKWAKSFVESTVAECVFVVKKSERK